MDNKRKTNTNRLDNYIRSYGTVLPKDILFYRGPDGDKHALCVFCDRIHDSVPILKHDFVKSESSQVVLGVFCCDTCAVPIERMEMRSMGDRPGDVLDNQDLIKKNREKNVSNFIREGLFPYFVHLYYQHLSTDDPLQPTHRTDQCVFCDEKVQEFVPDSFMVQAPMGPDVYHLDGGEVLVCELCAALIKENIPEIHFEGWLKNTFVEKECPKCSTAFLITKDEDEYQAMSKTSGKHLCPSCAYTNVNRSSEGPLYYRAQETDGKLKRYMDSLCVFCSEYFGVDQTLSETYLLKKHVTDAGQITCLDCCYHDYQPVYALRVRDMIWTFYYNDDSKKSFVVKRELTKHQSEVQEFSNTADMYKFFNRLEEIYNG